MPDLKITRVPIDSIFEDPANARLHGERNLESIIGSLRRFGQVEPLVVRKGDGRIIGGNGRHVAMKALGWKECDVVEVDVTDSAATALGIALNRTAELAEWNEETLAQLLSSPPSSSAGGATRSRSSRATSTSRCAAGASSPAGLRPGRTMAWSSRWTGACHDHDPCRTRGVARRNDPIGDNLAESRHGGAHPHCVW